MERNENVRMTAEMATSALARTIHRVTESPGDYQTALPELTLHQRNAPTDEVYCIFTLGLAFTAQGSKQVLLGDKIYAYGPGQSMLTTIDLPVAAHVTRATTREPYLGLVLRFDANAIIQAASELDIRRPNKSTVYEPISIQRLDPPLLEALDRLLRLLDEPKLLPSVAPLVKKEILFRLLTGPHASYLSHLVTAANPRQEIAKSVAWIKQNFADPMRVEDLAAGASMSQSTFNQHFRQVTGMSPLQFQKQVRLQEARQLMLNENMSAIGASAMVGYESASQFSREYRRLFGTPPQRDINRLLTG